MLCEKVVATWMQSCQDGKKINVTLCHLKLNVSVDGEEGDGTVLTQSADNGQFLASLEKVSDTFLQSKRVLLEFYHLFDTHLGRGYIKVYSCLHAHRLINVKVHFSLSRHDFELQS